MRGGRRRRAASSVASAAVVVQQGVEVGDGCSLKLERRGAALFLTVQFLGDCQDVPTLGDHVPAAGVIEVVGVKTACAIAIVVSRFAAGSAGSFPRSRDREGRGVGQGTGSGLMETGLQRSEGREGPSAPPRPRGRR